MRNEYKYWVCIALQTAFALGKVELSNVIYLYPNSLILTKLAPPDVKQVYRQSIVG